MCAATYNPYWEAKLCIAPPPTPTFVDCAHDMNSVGSQCYRCLRYYGKSGLNACFKCYPNCLQCTGPNSDQCTYCGMGYGFTGISCTICADDETWDLSKNLCQKKKALYLEMNYDLSSFGSVQLYFVPLLGYADLSLYYEYMFDKFWLIDINRNYEFSRTYPNLPLHRKVSISFELLSIDTRHYQHAAWSVDGIYLGFIFWNLEDQDLNVTTSYWAYSYMDMLPTKFSYTIFHSASSMTFQMKPFFNNDYGTLWVRELNVTFFGCFESCATCWEDNSPVHCITCLPGYYFTNFQCKACSANCSTCLGDPYTCTSCPNTQVLLGSNCIVGCGLGYYVNAMGVCQTCPATCIQCNSATSCITCVNGNYLDATSMCVACAGSCKTCQGTSTYCLSCNAGLLLQAGNCQASCTGSYYQIGSMCQACPTGCTTCTSTACTACNGGYRFKGTICANPCGNGWYANTATTCAQCLAVCETCSSGTACDTCKPGYVGASCLACQAPCLTCSGAPTTCTSCTPGSSYYLQLGGGTCVTATNCQASSYAESNNQCMACASECATCVDYPDKCLTCSDPTKVWKNYKCIGACTTGYTRISDICCPEKCTGCDLNEACSGCITGYYLDVLKACQACDSSCGTCSKNSTNCLTCPIGKVLQGNVCQDQCNQKYFSVAGVCKACHASCKNCNGTADTNCIGCENLYVPWKSKCWSCMNNQTDFDNSRFEEKGGRCWEKCGINGKLSIDDVPEGLGGYKACDDGNLINGDGCSSSCTVEKNYNCAGGSLSTVDICYPLTKPNAELVAINNSTDFQIVFSKNVTFKNLSAPNQYPTWPLTIEIAKVDSSVYRVTRWTAPQNSSFDYINFTISSTETLINAKLTLYFDRSVIMDQYNNTLSNIKLSANITIVVDKKFIFEPFLSSIQMVNKVSEFVVPVGSLGISNFILQNFVRYMTTFQIIGYGLFMNVNQSSTISSMLSQSYKTTERTLPSPASWMKSKLVVDKNDSPLDPKVKTWSKRVLGNTTTNTTTNATTKTNTTTTSTTKMTSASATNTSVYAQMYNTDDAPWSFRRNGYGNYLVPNLSFTIVVILLTGIWYMFASALLIGKVTIKDGKCKRFLAFTAERSFYTAMMFGALELSLFATRNIVSPKFNHIGHILSFLLSFMVMSAVISLPVILYKIANHDVATLWHPEYYERYGFIYCEFKLNHKLKKCFMSILMGRVVMFGIFVSALADFPIAQTIMVFIVHLSYYAVLLKTKPFVSMIMFITTIVAEFFIVVSALCFVVSAVDNSGGALKTVKNRELVDMVNCCAIIAAVFFTLVGIMLMVILKLVQCVKKLRSKNSYSRIMPDRSEKAKLVVNSHGTPDSVEMLDKPEVKDEDFMASKAKEGAKKEFDFGGFEDEFMKEEEKKEDADQYF